MSNLTPHQQAALRTKGHLALTANAGSGKTFVLARKYLDAIIQEGLDVSSIAAITFTDKAASELYLKISLLISEKISESTDRSEKKKLEKVRRQLVSANISTIHSFCINILRDYPVEAQLDARFVPIDEKLSEELIDLSVEEMIRASFDDDLVSEELKYLIRVFASKAKLQSQLVKLIQNRKNVFTIQENIYSADLKTIADSFTKNFSDHFLTIWKKKEKEFINLLQIINSEVLSNDSSNKIALEIQSNLNLLKTQTDVDSILKNLNSIKQLALTKELTLRKRGYLSKDTAELMANEIRIVESFMDEFKNFETSDNDKDVEMELARCGKTLLSFFDYALKIYETKKKAEGYIDYEDILLHTKLLLSNDNVKKSITEKYRFIMVDEFQDTNEIQYQIFLPILDYLKSGRLFIVGDEKQSIYKFRDAEIEIFNLTRNDIKNFTGDNHLLVLPDSFRMTKNICVFCNRLFRKLFDEPDEKFGEVPPTDLVCARTDNMKGRVEFLIAKTEDETPIISEVELVARKTLNLINEKKYSFKDIAILVRKRKYFSDLEKVFIKYKIPFNIVGGRGFYQRQIINDIYNYLSFLADKYNNAALVGLLRSPFFNISDAKLFEISLLQGKSIWKKINNADSDKDLIWICDLLKENLSLSSSVDLPQLITKIITDNNYLTILKSRDDGEQEIANISKLISLARNFNSTGFQNLYDFISFLKESISNLTDESQASTAEDSDAAQLMTIHQSKGLEFPVVFLYKTDESGISGSVKSGEVKIDKKFGALTKVPLNQNYTDEFYSAPIVTLHNYFEAKKNNAELKRLLYVAVTRAKDELYITASIEKDTNLKNDSFVKLLTSGLETNLNESEILINDQLEFLKYESNTFINTKSKVELVIPITSQIEEREKRKIERINPLENIQINTSHLSSKEKGEIISASKVSIYSQCPLKYLLTYDYGFGKLNSDYRNYGFVSQKNNYNMFMDLEDENIDETIETVELNIEKRDSALYGKLFHMVIEQSILLDGLDKYLQNKIASEFGDSVLSKEIINLLKIDLQNYYQSKTYSFISSFPSFKNEFEIYVREKDYYLHGIIDKIIFSDRKILICDYKTDDIEKKEIKKHAEYYLMQLKFYLYIASRLFSEFDNFEGSLVFVKYPDELVTLNYNKSEIKNLEKEIAGIIESIRNKNAEKNFNHCKVCSFSGSSNKCIIS
jgi:ATP-dependent helicase/nuclease subunit A